MELGPRGLSRDIGRGDPKMSNINIGAREAVITSFARTPIGKAYRGAFNDTGAPALAGPPCRCSEAVVPITIGANITTRTLTPARRLIMRQIDQF